MQLRLALTKWQCFCLGFLSPGIPSVLIYTAKKYHSYFLQKVNMKMIRLDNFHQLRVLSNYSFVYYFPSLLMWFGEFFLLLFPELTGGIDQTCMCVFPISLKNNNLVRSLRSCLPSFYKERIFMVKL